MSIDVKTSENSESDREKLKVFISYSHHDEEHCKELVMRLKPREKEEKITVWYDRELVAGEKWESRIEESLNNADIILLLISPDFLYSDYCCDEYNKAIERQKAEKIDVIPIILRPAGWQSSGLGHLQILPKDGKPVTAWYNKDEAWLDVQNGIEKAINKRLNMPDGAIQSTGQASQKANNQKNDKPAENTPVPVLVELGKQPGEFGWKQIRGAAYFATLIAGVNIGQRLWLAKNEVDRKNALMASKKALEIYQESLEAAKEPLGIVNEAINAVKTSLDSSKEALGQSEAIVLNLSMGTSVFFLTAAVLLFLSHESAKISMFIDGVTKKIATWYLSSLCFVMVFSHTDSFVPSRTLIMILSHIMLFVVCIIETMIDLKLAACFSDISDHFGEHAKVFKTASTWAIGIFLANMILAFLSISGYLANHVSWRPPYLWFLLEIDNIDLPLLAILFFINFIPLYITRRNLANIR
jgi:hypothetical protein